MALLRLGMTVCVESSIGPVSGDEGVKLEQPVLITETGPLPLTTCPFEDRYMSALLKPTATSSSVPAPRAACRRNG